MEAKILRLWDFVFEKLFNKETNLIYDQRTANTPDGNIVHLPTPEEIAAQAPNPCSWGSGMEDSMIHAGIMLDTVLNRYKATGEKQMTEYAKALFEGIKLCAEISDRRGFLARSVSPVDKKSYYINTSRDQYTHVIYSLLKYRESELCSNTDSEWIKNTLTAFATRVYEDATEQNGYQLMRADGKRGLVCKMWKVLPHEALRLPMFYLAAWVVSGDQKWLACYRALRDQAIERTLEKHTSANQYILMQAQYSARLVYDYDPDPEYKQKLLKVLEFNAKNAAKFKADALPSFEAANALSTQWRDCLLRYEWGHVVASGYHYPIPQEPQRHVCQPLREYGSAITNQYLCPGFEINPEQIAALYDSISLIDPENHATASPIHLLSGYWSLKVK